MTDEPIQGSLGRLTSRIFPPIQPPRLDPHDIDNRIGYGRLLMDRIKHRLNMPKAGATVPDGHTPAVELERLDSDRPDKFPIPKVGKDDITIYSTTLVDGCVIDKDIIDHTDIPYIRVGRCTSVRYIPGTGSYFTPSPSNSLDDVLAGIRSNGEHNDKYLAYMSDLIATIMNAAASVYVDRHTYISDGLFELEHYKDKDEDEFIITDLEMYDIRWVLESLLSIHGATYNLDVDAMPWGDGTSYLRRDHDAVVLNYPLIETNMSSFDLGLHYVTRPTALDPDLHQQLYIAMGRLSDFSVGCAIMTTKDGYYLIVPSPITCPVALPFRLL